MFICPFDLVCLFLFLDKKKQKSRLYAFPYATQPPKKAKLYKLAESFIGCSYCNG